jgi:hypothetical protein
VALFVVATQLPFLEHHHSLVGHDADRDSTEFHTGRCCWANFDEGRELFGSG